MKKVRPASLFKKPSFIILAVLITSTLFVAAIRNASIKRQSTSSLGEEHIPADSEALLLKDKQYFTPTPDVNHDHFIRKDLAYFARKNYKEYDQKTNPQVIFNVSKSTTDKDGAITFVGKFELVKDEFSVSVKLLQNDRIKSSIKNLKTGKIADSDLPSNTPRNQLIGRLPITSDNYDIGYLPALDKFDIIIVDHSNATLDEAVKVIATALNVKDLDKKEYNYYMGTEATDN